MSFPRLTPSTSPTSVIDSDSPDVGHKGESRSQGPDLQKGSTWATATYYPKYMTGYGGHQPHLDDEVDLPKIINAPVVGYTGSYRGKNLGKLGRCEVHRTRLSAWEKDTVSGILGVPSEGDEWEFSHHTNSCGNFSDKKYHESVSNETAFINSSTYGTGSFCPGGSAASFGAALNSQREQTGTDRILLQVQMALESRFRTATVARSALKSAFFAADGSRSGSLPVDVFFEVLRKQAGVALTEDQRALLAWAISRAGKHRTGSDGQSAQQRDAEYALGSARLEGDDDNDAQGGAGALRQAEGDEPQSVVYGRFLNIVVPRREKRLSSSGVAAP
jgi:hypothetical protein